MGCLDLMLKKALPTYLPGYSVQCLATGRQRAGLQRCETTTEETCSRNKWRQGFSDQQTFPAQTYTNMMKRSRV